MAGDITPAEREDAVRRLRAMLRWSSTSVAMFRALQVAISALQAVEDSSDTPRWPASGDGCAARQGLIDAMELCAINAPRAVQLRAGAMTTSLEDCAIRAIAHVRLPVCSASLITEVVDNLNDLPVNEEWARDAVPRLPGLVTARTTEGRHG